MRWLIMLLLLTGMAHANEVLVNTKDGQTFVFEVDPDESLNAIQERLSTLSDEAIIVAIPSKKQRWWDIEAGKQGGYLGFPRDFHAPVTPKEKSDIRFIVTSLADKSLVTIAFIKDDLEAAGDRIDHIHPLRFLSTIFTDEELKVGIRNIRGRGWIWNQFTSGLKESLETEMNIGNMGQEYLIHFANDVGLDVSRIYPTIAVQNWDGFIDTLIKEIPRLGDHDRYDAKKRA